MLNLTGSQQQQAKDALLNPTEGGVIQLLMAEPMLAKSLVQDPQGTLQKNKALQEALMNDPQMKEIVKKNMDDPRVQQFLKEKAREAATQAANNFRASAIAAGAKGLHAFKKYVQGGPAGIQMLCFLTGGFTVVVGIIGLIDVFGAIFSPFTFILNIYVLFFGLVTVVVEADEQRLADTPVLEYAAPKTVDAQKFFNSEAKFLTLLWGRGLFYIFIGLLMITQSCLVCLFFLAGAANITVGVLSLLTHFGVDVDIDYMQDQAGQLYERVSSAADADASQFSSAVESWKKSSAASDKLLKALYSQATVGDEKGERPSGFFNSGERAEYDARVKLQGMTTLDAKKEFVARCKAKGLSW
ncbi:unnamed protein product [Amoebophrya sp. A25]|nr:unnamed protein product [Amoebophrya sp. A25]|eukprot:GSA25T00005271001.1